MILKKRFFKLPSFIITEQQKNPLTKDLYLCELAEILIKKDTLWSDQVKLEDHQLIFCTKGGGIIQILNDMIPFSQNQYCIIPQGYLFNL